MPIPPDTVSPKPLVFFPINTGGGARKSGSMALCYHTLVAMGLDPIVVALDSNDSFQKLLLGKNFRSEETPHGLDIFTWDLNSGSDAFTYLHPVLEKAELENRPVVFDIAAKAGASMGAYTLTETGIFGSTTLIGIAPVCPDEKFAAGIIEALLDINPDKWIKVLYSGRSTRMPQTAIFATLDELLPIATAVIPELNPTQANALVADLPVVMPKLSAFIATGGFAATKWIFAREYWNKAQASLHEALLAVPELTLMLTQISNSPATPGQAEAKVSKKKPSEDAA